MEKKIKQCKKCQTDFIIENDDFSFYDRMKVLIPSLCPTCRFKIRAQWRNERTLYSRNCDLCQSSIITMYNPKSAYVVYCNDCWVSDKWNPEDYALEYDYTRPFFSQLEELNLKVPKSATYSTPLMGPNINSEYTNFAGGNKDGYLIFNSGPKNENCAYGRGLKRCRDTFDAYFADDLESSYEVINVHKSNKVNWAQNVNESFDSSFLLNCSAVSNCFGCVNLRHKSYHFLNEPLSQEQWHRKVEEIMGSYKKIEEFKIKFQELAIKFPKRSDNNLKAESSIGDYIFESKNCFNCFEVSESENVRYSFSVKNLKDSSDALGHGRNSELVYNSVGVGSGAKNVLCSWWVEASSQIEYCFATRSSNDCIGCDGIKNGAYVILNKRYSKEDYEKIRLHILAELGGNQTYGDFFPLSMAPFAYNETVAQDNFPLSKDKVVAEGYRWEEDIQETRGKETMAPDDIPDHIKDVSIEIINEVFACLDCSRNYKIFERELAFYKKNLIPLPRKCWNCRFTDRIIRRGPYKFWKRNCAKCDIEIVTNYAPERPGSPVGLCPKEIVYCESCYQKEVY